MLQAPVLTPTHKALCGCMIVHQCEFGLLQFCFTVITAPCMALTIAEHALQHQLLAKRPLNTQSEKLILRAQLHSASGL